MTKQQALFIAAILTEMKSNLLRSHVEETAINTAIITTCGNLAGNAYDLIVNEVLGAPTAAIDEVEEMERTQKH